MVDVKEILKKVPRRGMSRSCQERLQQVAEDYFNGVDAQQTRLRLPKGERGLADKIYGVLNGVVKPRNIIRATAEAIAKREGRSYQDFLRPESEGIFANGAMKYLISKGEQLSDVFDEMGGRGDELRRTDKRALYSAFVALSREPKFYELLAKHV